MRIADVVQANVYGAFVTDVQVSSYRDPEANLQLAKSYIFTSAAADHEVGSLELLEDIVASYLPGRHSNRVEVIATFGHGKSHFAVAAATFFGRPIDSPAWSAIFDGLKHAVNNPARIDKLKTFKEHRKPFLVVLLRGDEPGDLPSKFAKGLEEAINDHPETRGIRPPFWFTEAEHFLDRLAESQREMADRVLAAFHLDLPSLRRRLSQRDDDVYDACRELYKELTGSYPDFQGAANLRQLVEWVADELCGPQGPAGGLLILFDEFSTFISMYGTRRSGRYASPLQDLLNGVQQRRERVTFVALGQLDSRTVAKDDPDARHQSIFKELDRIEKRVRLKSVLEEVLDSYLKQEVDWLDLPQGDRVSQAIEDATTMTWTVFQKRYQKDLGWDRRMLLRRVGWGCFPLHPMTTALFSTIEYQATSQARSVLQFVLSALQRRADQPVVIDNTVNWVLPCELVDYFGEMIDPRIWSQYDETLSNLGGNVTRAESLVLKALYLISAASVPTRETGFAEIVAAFSGLSLTEARETLHDLHERGYIRQDEVSQSYAFWPVGGGAYRAEQVIQRALQRVPTVTEEILTHVESVLKLFNQLPDMEVDTDLGHPEDWMARQVLVLSQSISDPNRLMRIARSVTIDPLGLTSRPELRRGAVVWILPLSEADIAWCQQELPRLVDETFGDDAAVPLLLMRPTHTDTNLLYLIRRLYALQNIPRDDLREIGPERFEETRAQAAKKLGEIISDFWKTSAPLVPTALRGAVDTSRSARPESLLQLMYREAFREGPGEFFSSYKVSNTNFSKAVISLARALCDDSLASQTALLALDKIAKEIVEKALVQKWKIFGSGRQLQKPPAESPVRPGWDLLDQEFPRGCKSRPIGNLLSRLLNPPYGYDPRTLTLLMAAWYGLNRHELSLSLDGSLTRLEDQLISSASKKQLTPAELIRRISTGTISRQDPAELERAIEDIVQRIGAGTARFSQQEAENALRQLVQFAGYPSTTGAMNTRVAVARKKLEQALQQAHCYDEVAARLLDLARNWSTARPDELVAATREVANLVLPTLVTVRQPDPVELDRAVREALAQQVGQLCSQWEQLPGLESYKKHNDLLQYLEKLLREFPTEAKRVSEARQRLETSKAATEQRLADERHDEQLRAELSGMTVGADVGVATLQKYLTRLEAMEPRSEACGREIAQKRDAVERALETITRRVEELPARLDQANTRGQIQAIRDEIVMLKARVLESDLEDALAQALDRSDALLDFFGKLEAIKPDTVTTPDQAGQAEEDLVQLERQHETLSDTHRARIAEVREQLRAHVRSQEERASAWLRSLEARLAEGGDPWEMERLAQEVPPFLPDHDRAALEKLRLRIRAEKDRDAGRQIRELFGQIADEQERQSLARELWELAFGRSAVGVSRS